MTLREMLAKIALITDSYGNIALDAEVIYWADDDHGSLEMTDTHNIVLTKGHADRDGAVIEIWGR